MQKIYTTEPCQRCRDDNGYSMIPYRYNLCVSCWKEFNVSRKAIEAKVESFERCSVMNKNGNKPNP